MGEVWVAKLELKQFDFIWAFRGTDPGRKLPEGAGAGGRCSRRAAEAVRLEHYLGSFT